MQHVVFELMNEWTYPLVDTSWYPLVDQLSLFYHWSEVRDDGLVLGGDSNVGTFRYCEVSLFDSIWLSDQCIDITNILIKNIDISECHMIYFNRARFLAFDFPKIRQ